MRYVLAYGNDRRRRRGQRIRGRRAAAPAVRAPRARRRPGHRPRERGGAPRVDPSPSGQPGRPGAGADRAGRAGRGRPGLPRAAARAVRRGRRRPAVRPAYRRPGRRPPAGLGRGLGGDLRGSPPRLLALWVARAARPAGGHRRGQPGGRDRVLCRRHDRSARPADRRRSGRAGRRGGRRRLRHLRRRPFGQGPSAGQRGDGRPLALQRGPPPARAGDPAGHRRDVGLVHAGAGADAAGNPRHRDRPPGPPGRDRGRGPRGARPGLPGGAVRAAAARRAVAAHRGDARQQQCPPAGDGRRRLRPGGRLQRHRQPRQGCSRPGRAVRQPAARPAGDDRPAGGRGGPVSVTAARGFRAAGVAAGLKSSGGLDVALVVNDGPLDAAAGVFTSNRVKAAPVLWSEQVLGTGRLGAVVLNSGGANACTGPAGFADTHATAEAVAAALGIGAIDVAVCSTGLIGERLPMPQLLAGIEKAAASLAPAAGDDAARAIMTTDTVPKTAGVTGDGWMVGGMAKGAGMLAPGLATMLCVLTTDAVVDPAGCDAALRVATARTFDRVDSDGCMSTNDTVLLLASGASGVAPEPAAFAAAVERLCADLCRQLLADAEGATKDVAIEVGRAVARSNLLKCAFFGNDPNWGRVLAAVGTTSAAFEPDALDVAINGVQVCRAGAAGEPRELVDLSGRDIAVLVDLHAGPATATIWTNDLSLAYVD